jgi:hypothetical protein
MSGTAFGCGWRRAVGGDRWHGAITTRQFIPSRCACPLPTTHCPAFGCLAPFAALCMASHQPPQTPAATSNLAMTECRMRSGCPAWPQEQEAGRQVNGIRLPTRGRTRVDACHPMDQDSDRLTAHVRRCVSNPTHYLSQLIRRALALAAGGRSVNDAIQEELRRSDGLYRGM